MPPRVAAALLRTGLADKRLALGLSGGLDSTVLLDVLAQLRQQHPFRLSAVHVNHRISPDAGRWARVCATRCAAYGVPCALVEVEVVRTGAEGLEAAARAARYAQYQRQDADAIVLAHHLDDQAETLLLRLLRGAGARGLSAMPEVRPLARGSPVLVLRPLLGVARSELAAYARQRCLQWVEDEANADLDFDRNWLRHEVLPRIAARFPAYRETWLRAAHNLAEANQLCDALGGLDAAAVATGEGLRATALMALGEVRARNVLRWFLERNGAPPPARERLDQALRQLSSPRADAQPAVDLGAVSLRRHRGAIQLVARADPMPVDWRAIWRGEAQLMLPSALGALRFEACAGAGLSRERLTRAPVSVRFRAGGERFKPAPARPLRTLKNLLREAGIPAWRRERLPILFCGDAPVWLPGLGCDARFAAAPGEPGVLVQWEEMGSGL